MGRALISKVAPSIFTRDRPYAYFNRKDAATINHDMLDLARQPAQGTAVLRFPQLLTMPMTPISQPREPRGTSA